MPQPCTAFAGQGATETTANRWVSCETRDGRFLDDLYQNLGSMDDDTEDGEPEGESVFGGGGRARGPERPLPVGGDGRSS